MPQKTGKENTKINIGQKDKREKTYGKETVRLQKASSLEKYRSDVYKRKNVFAVPM